MFVETMMHKVNLLIMASMLALSTSSALAAETKSVEPADGSQQFTRAASISGSDVLKDRMMQQRGMFEGLELSAKQRQQMRDLIRQNYHDAMPKMYLDNVEAMHSLIISDSFDEAAAFKQAELIAQAQAERQVALAKVGHQFYSLLTPEQKDVFNQRHAEKVVRLQQKLDEMRKYEDPQPQ